MVTPTNMCTIALWTGSGCFELGHGLVVTGFCHYPLRSAAPMPNPQIYHAIHLRFARPIRCWDNCEASTYGKGHWKGKTVALIPISKGQLKQPLTATRTYYRDSTAVS